MSDRNQQERDPAREVRLIGGETVAGQLEVAQLAALGREVLAATSADTTDKALLKVTAGLAALEEVGPLREAARARAAQDESRARHDRLAQAVARGALTRAQAFDISEEIVDGKAVEKLTPKAAWLRGSLSDLEEQLKALGSGGAPPRPRYVPDDEGEAGIAERARRSGMTVEERRTAEMNVDRGRAATEG